MKFKKFLILALSLSAAGSLSIVTKNIFFDTNLPNRELLADSTQKGQSCVLETLKTAIDMLKNSCYEEGVISKTIKNIDTSKLTYELFSKDFFGGTKSQEVRAVNLGNIEIQFGSASSKMAKGLSEFDTTNSIEKRIAKAQKRDAKPFNDNSSDNIMIQINQDAFACDPEKLKGILYHELVHEQQMRQTGLGFWDTSGAHTKPIGSKAKGGTNGVDTRLMVLDCMEVEAHLRTARCMQKELKIPEYKKHEKSIMEILAESKRYAEKTLYNGDQKESAYSRGCLTYINSLKNNTDLVGNKIKSPDALEENKKILTSYMNNWLKRLQDLSVIFYEKFYLDPKDSAAGAKDKLEKFKKFEKTLYLPASNVDKVIEQWKKIQEADSKLCLPTPPKSTK